MTKRFIVATDPLTPDQEKIFHQKLLPAGWWHWLPNFWLIRDNTDSLTAASIRDSLRNINGSARCLVLEVDPITWAALTKKDQHGRGMAQWITDHWSSKP